ncbi:MAG TPA: NUDIX domain-containing protein [Opitutaceae bacterium]
MHTNVKDGGVAQRPDELFDIVNERDEVVGQATRAEVHARRLWHRAVHVLVFDGRGRVFLQKRSMAKDTAPGCWDSSCSGHLDSGEAYDAAAMRELREEIGLAVESVPERWFRLAACQETGWEFVWMYRLQNDGPFVLHPAEIEHGAWFAPAEVTAAIAARPREFSGAFRHLWAEAVARL